MLENQSAPRPEIDYTGKLERDFMPIRSALQAYNSKEAAEREVLIAGKKFPELQMFMENSQLFSVDLVVHSLDRVQRNNIVQLISGLQLMPGRCFCGRFLIRTATAGRGLCLRAGCKCAPRT